MMKLLLLLALAIAAPAWGQIRAIEDLSPAQRADYRKLMFGYRDTFRMLGRAKVCKLNFDAEPFFREVENRHGEGSEPVLIAQMSYASGAENVMLSRELDPTPPAPIPCDVLWYMRGMQLPELPRSLSPVR
jgi:hypothetical protein